MAQLNNVNPGDLIKAADWNALVAAVEALSGPVAVVGVPVPDLFGLTLGTAVTIINTPSSQLSLGHVLDTFGNQVDPSQPSSLNHVVLGQSPSVGTSVTAGTGLNLVVSPTPGSPSIGPQRVIVSVFSVQGNLGGGYTAANNTITFPFGTAAPAFVVFQAIAPNTDPYICDNPTFDDSTSWSGSITGGNTRTPAGPGGAVQYTVKVDKIPAGPASTVLHFGATSTNNSQISGKTTVTISVAAAHP